jgi:hypothetical protein
MQINLNKRVFTSTETGFILDKLEQASVMGFIATRSENNPHLLKSYAGVEESGITPKWNVKIYAFNKKKKGHSLVCGDKNVLSVLLDEDYEALVTPNLQVIRIDDAGWGFPLCGVMVGVSDEKTVLTAIVPVEFFRNDTDNRFDEKHYLKYYADLAIRLLHTFGATPDNYRIEICTGYINKLLKEELRKFGFDVRVVEITGLLQEELEAQYRKYVLEEVALDIYFDPKDMKKADIPRRYQASLNYGERHCPHQIKTGWNSTSTSRY